MTTITEQGYQQFKMLSNNMMFRKHVKDCQDEITKILMSLLMYAPSTEHKTMFSRVLLLRDKYYLYISGGSLHLFTRDFKSAIRLMLNNLIQNILITLLMIGSLK